MKIKDIELTGAQETLLITLYEKALDYQSPKSILHDKLANDIVIQNNIDVSKYSQLISVTPVRAKQFDDWVREFYTSHPAGTIIYLGCGLDTRYYRTTPPEAFQWYDVDFPEVIELREKLLPIQRGYHMLKASITEDNWFKQIPKDLPVLIVAEGVLEYLEEAEVSTLLQRLTNYFASGYIAFDVMNTFAVESGKKQLQEATNAIHKWAVDDLTSISKLANKLRLVESSSVYRLSGMKKLPLKMRVLYRVLSLNKNFRNMIRVLKYSF